MPVTSTFTPFSAARAAQQAAFYAAQGSRAFGAHAVPWRLSTGWAMAEVVARAAQSLLGGGATSVRVVDLGAGTGRLGFHAAVLLASRRLPAHVVLTETAQSTVDAWRVHPQLAPLLEDGLLAARRVDVLDSHSLESVLEPKPDEALLLVGTYLFDTLPHELIERRVDGSVWRGGEDASGTLSFEPAPDELFPPGVVLPSGPQPARCFVPTGALAAVAAIEQARAAPCWLLVADKGPLTWVDAWETDALRWVSHEGAWSVAVNFPLLFDALRPRPFVTAPENVADFSVHALGLGGASPADAARLAAALADAPHPLTAHRQLLEAIAPPLDVDRLLSLQPTGDALMNAAELLRAEGPGLSSDARVGLARWVLTAVESSFVVPSDDVCFHAGAVLQRLGLLEPAAWAYQQSVERYGAHASAHFNLALCLLDLGRPEAARGELQTALALDPRHRRAAELLQSL